MGAAAGGTARSEFPRSGAAGDSQRGCLFFESARAAAEEAESVRRTLEELDLNYFIPCRFRDRTAAMLGLGKTVDGDYLSSEDLELLSTIAGYVAIAIENARLYHRSNRRRCKSSG